MKSHLKHIWVYALAIIIPFIFMSCGSDDDNGNECEGEYIIAKPKQSGFSKHAVGEWYYNNVIYVSNTYYVEGNEVYVNEFDSHTNSDTKLLFKIVNGKLVKQKWSYEGADPTLVDGDVYTKQ